MRGGPWGVLGVLGGALGGVGGGAPSLWEASGGPQGSDTKFVGRRRGPVFDPDPPKNHQKTIGNMCVSATRVFWWGTARAAADCTKDSQLDDVPFDCECSGRITASLAVSPPKASWSANTHISNGFLMNFRRTKAQNGAAQAAHGFCVASLGPPRGAPGKSTRPPRAPQGPPRSPKDLPRSTAQLLRGSFWPPKMESVF